MYPITLDVSHIHILLVGEGKAATRRFEQLQEAGARHITRFQTTLPSQEAIAQAHIVMVVDVADEVAGNIADIARELNVLVNVEDRLQWCDFHFASLFRRGDLLFTVSTAGKSPTLAKRIIKKLKKLFPDIWGERLDEIARFRDKWKEQGNSMSDIARKSEQLIDENKWLDNF